MNRSALRSALKLRLQIPTVGDAWLDDGTLNTLIDQALRDLSNEADWPWLVQTTSLTFSSGAAAVPSDYVKSLHLYVNNQPAKYLPLAAFLDQKALNAQSVWTVIGSNVTLSPVPTTSPTNTFYYQRSEPSLATDAAAPLCPEQYQDTVLARAAYRANVRRKNNEDAARDNAEYEAGVRKMKDAAWARSGPRTVRAAGSTFYASWG